MTGRFCVDPNFPHMIVDGAKKFGGLQCDESDAEEYCSMLNAKAAGIRVEALDDVLAMLNELHLKASAATPLEKGMRMAIGSAMDRVIAMKNPDGFAAKLPGAQS